MSYELLLKRSKICQFGTEVALYYYSINQLIQYVMSYFAPIYRFAECDCSNHGPSSRHNYMTVIEEDQAEKYLAESEEPDKILVLVRRILWGKDSWYLRPLVKQKGKVGPMFGGNYAKVREVSEHLLPIHDRYETQEEYETLSI